MPAMTTDTDETGVAVLAVMLAACAGSVDVFAFFGLGKAFAGIVTGNLVTVGFGVATGNLGLIRPTLTAVAGCVAGEISWAWLLRRPRAALALLISELVILLGVLAAWLAADAKPSGVVALVLLAAVSVAMGGQSMWALRIHQTTTYFTGMLTKAISGASAGSTGGLRTGIRQFAALLAGAIAGGAVLARLRLAAPAVPVALLAAAITAHMIVTRTSAVRDRAAAPDGGEGPG
jgi:uncharacterized membrane protein YoaK (UPF0700 family)